VAGLEEVKSPDQDLQEGGGDVARIAVGAEIMLDQARFDLAAAGAAFEKVNYLYRVVGVYHVVVVVVQNCSVDLGEV